MKIRIENDGVYVSVANKKKWLKCEWGGVFSADYAAGKETHRGRVIEGGEISPTVTAVDRILRIELIETNKVWR